MKAHFAAFKALLMVVALLVGKVFTSVRFESGKPVRANYVVLFPDGPADLGDDRFAAPQRADSKSRWRYDVRVVAVDADGLLLLADAVLSVIGKIPAVVGRRCDPVTLVPSVEEGKARYDETTDLHYMDLSFEFWSRRAI
ncbi:hypothetical protein CQ047_17835 [Microbacterium sp. MYb72]|uniref:hypothetical protein n=1 Tax=Microbacterium sp. MYb72 TaxID=1848693 RepID=UPI000CFE1DFE|nr:hypothetical protein [Microbacterium sp. MYb72]PRB02765.1 hypothetical protein CQ047_17835 [Microbacterium sp. MYb72]